MEEGQLVQVMELYFVLALKLHLNLKIMLMLDDVDEPLRSNAIPENCRDVALSNASCPTRRTSMIFEISFICAPHFSHLDTSSSVSGKGHVPPHAFGHHIRSLQSTRSVKVPPLFVGDVCAQSSQSQTKLYVSFNSLCLCERGSVTSM